MFGLVFILAQVAPNPPWNSALLNHPLWFWSPQQFMWPSRPVAWCSARTLSSGSRDEHGLSLARLDLFEDRFVAISGTPRGFAGKLTSAGRPRSFGSNRVRRWQGAAAGISPDSPRAARPPL